MEILRKYKVDEHFPAPGFEHLVTIGGETPIADALKVITWLCCQIIFILQNSKNIF